MTETPARRRALLKPIDGGSPHIKLVIEATHLMRVDGIERLRTVKVGYGPVAGYLEALARAMSSALAKRPEDLQPDDLAAGVPNLSAIDWQMRQVSETIERRASSRHPEDERARRTFEAALRQRVAARLLSRLTREFVVAANRLIMAEARRREAFLWL